MGIETAFESIAKSLERIAVAQERAVEIGEWNKRRYEAKAAAAEPAPTEPAAESAPTESAPTEPAAEPAAPEASALDRDALLKECAELGIEVPKGTKTPTLEKKIAEKKAELAAKKTEPAEEVVEGEVVEPAPKALTYDEARAELTRLVGGNAKQMSPEQSAALRKVLGQFGAVKLVEVKPENLRVVVNRFKSAIGALDPKPEPKDEDLL